MPPGVPDPQAVLRGHRGEVQALDFDEDERCLVSGDSLGEVRVWDLQDLRPAAIRRLHPLSGGILSLRLFRSAGRRLLGTQGRDGATMLWACNGTGADLQLSEEPVRTFVRDCYSFCRFDVLFSGGPADKERGSSSGSSGSAGDGAAQQQEEQLAEAFLQSVLTDGQQLPAAPAAASSPPRCEASLPEQPAGVQGPPGSEQREIQALAAPAEAPAGGAAADRGAPYSPAAVAAAIWAVHPCGQASAAQPSALLAIPGADERTAEVVCAACGQQVAEFIEAAAGRKLGMLMALQLFCAAPAGAGLAHGAAALEATGAAPPPAGSAGHTGPAMAASLSAAADAGTTVAADSVPATASPSPLPPRILLAAGYEAGSVAVWELGAAPGAAPLAQRQLCSEPVMALAIDSAGSGGAAGSAEEQVVAFKLVLAASPARLSVRHIIEVAGKGRAGVGDVAVRPDRRLLVTAGWDGRVRLYKYRSGRPLAVLKVGAKCRADLLPAGVA
ncbi:hypothetical protein ABPG75_005511 [Micractinium tetrahymenae]